MHFSHFSAELNQFDIRLPLAAYALALSTVHKPSDSVSRTLGWRKEDALSDDRPTPDVLDFIAGLIRSGFCLTTGSKAFAYLDECQRTSSLPDKGRLLRILMPWYVPGDLSAPIASVAPDVAALIAKQESQRPGRSAGFPKIPGVDG